MIQTAARLLLIYGAGVTRQQERSRHEARDAMSFITLTLAPRCRHARRRAAYATHAYALCHTPHIILMFIYAMRQTCQFHFDAITLPRHATPLRQHAPRIDAEILVHAKPAIFSRAAWFTRVNTAELCDAAGAAICRAAFVV